MASGFRLAVAATGAAVLLLVARPAQAEQLEKTLKLAGTTVDYTVVLPNGYEASKIYPAILVFGGGPQTMDAVDSTLERNFRAEAEQRGYVVVGPAAPDGDLFFQEGERIFPEFLDRILATYKIRDNKFHVAGPSNGGISALHVAAAHPKYFLSVTAFPGYMWETETRKLLAISRMCVFLYVGELDRYRWHDEMKREVDVLRREGGLARFFLEKGQPHRLESLAGANAVRLFEGFEEAGKGCRQ